MANSSPVRGFQALNSRIQKSRSPATNKCPKTSNDAPLIFGRIPFSAIQASTVPTPSSPGGIIKPIPRNQQRNSSTISLSNILPHRKSLQTTALATRRQSLWMNIAKNAPQNTNVQPILPLRTEHSSLMRKKILRLLLVFSYLLSISLLAIALATFYGFFWSGYSTPQPTSLVNGKTTVRSLISLTSNSTFVDYDSDIENDFSTKNPS